MAQFSLTSRVPEDDLDDDQRAALDRARYRLRDIFDVEHDDRDFAAEQAIRMASRVRDEQVRAALAPSVAYRLALDGKGEAALARRDRASFGPT